MPKKIFNSDLETSGGLKATSVTANTLTDGSATINGGVLTASTLTDGTATLSGGDLLAQNIQASNVLATSTLRSNSNSLSVINTHGDSDGGSDTTPFIMSLERPAQASGAVQIIETNAASGAVAGVRLAYQGDSGESLGVYNAGITNNISAIQAVNKADSASAQTSHNVLSFGSTGNGVRLESADDITLVPAQDSGQVHIARDSSANGPIGLTIRKPINGSAYLSVVEGVSTLYGGRLAYEGDHTANSEGVVEESLGVGILDTVALQALSAGTARNVLSYKYTGSDVTLQSTTDMSISANTINLQSNNVVFSDFEEGSGSQPETFTISMDSYSNAVQLQTSGSCNIKIDADESSTTDIFRVLSTGQTGDQPLFEINTDITPINNYTVDKFKGTRIFLPWSSGVSPAPVFQALDGYTAIRGNGDVHLTLGNNASQDLDYSDNKFSFRRPSGYASGIPDGEEEVAYITSGGSLFCSVVVPRNGVLVQGGGLTFLGADSQNQPILTVPVADTVGWYDLVVNPGGLSGGSPNNTSMGTVYADESGFTGVHRYLSEVDASLLLPGNSVALNSNNRLELTTASNQPNAVGIIGKVQRISDNEIATGAKDSLGTEAANSGASSLVFVLSVGDTKKGEVRGFNVCNENGDIQPGDLLVTSSTPGYLMKQDDDIMRAKTVGKAMEAVTFDANGQATGVYGFIYCG